MCAFWIPGIRPLQSIPLILILPFLCTNPGFIHVAVSSYSRHPCILFRLFLHRIILLLLLFYVPRSSFPSTLSLFSLLFTPILLLLSLPSFSSFSPSGICLSSISTSDWIISVYQEERFAGLRKSHLPPSVVKFQSGGGGGNGRKRRMRTKRNDENYKRGKSKTQEGRNQDIGKRDAMDGCKQQ